MVDLIDAEEHALLVLAHIGEALEIDDERQLVIELGHLRDKARAAGLETRMVTYEDLAANATAFAQLANWLQGGGSKCPSAALDSSREVDGPGARAVLKIHSKRLNETVLNWNVVVKTLTGTEFERFLHDDA